MKLSLYEKIISAAAAGFILLTLGIYVGNDVTSNHRQTMIIESVATTPSAAAGVTRAAAGQGIININTADKTTLMELPGIGTTKAAAIIAYRQKTKFAKIDDIQNVTGIGPATFGNIKSLICVN